MSRSLIGFPASPARRIERFASPPSTVNDAAVQFRGVLDQTAEIFDTLDAIDQKKVRKELRDAEAAYIAGTAADLADLADEEERNHPDDPEGFATAFAKRSQGFLLHAPTEHAGTELTAEARRLNTAKYRTLYDQRAARARSIDTAEHLRAAERFARDYFEAARAGRGEVRFDAEGRPRLGGEMGMLRERALGHLASMLSRGIRTADQTVDAEDALIAEGGRQIVLGHFERTLATHGPAAARDEMKEMLALIPDPEVSIRVRREMEDQLAVVDKKEQEMRTRKETIEAIRLRGRFSQAAQAELERIQTEKDISREDTAGEFAKFLADEQTRLVNESHLSDEAKATLFKSLEEQRFKLGSEAGALSMAAQRKIVHDTLGSDINALTARAIQHPDDLPTLFRDLDDKVDELAPALTSEDEMTYRDLGRRELALNAIDGYLSRGRFESAQELIDSSPGILTTLPPEQQRRILGAIAEARGREEKYTRDADAKLVAAERIKGARLTLSERLRLAGLASPGGETSLASKVTEMETVLGRPLTDAEKKKAAGLGDPATPLTDAGKLLHDREMYVAQFGPRSEQVAAFDELAKDTGDTKISDRAGIRKEFVSASREFVDVRDAATKVATAARLNSSAGDIALIYGFVRMQSPGIVSDREADLIASTGGAGERVKLMWERAKSGERLTEDMRAELASAAESILYSQIRSQISLENEYSRIATQEGIDPGTVIVDFVGPYRVAVSTATARPGSGAAAAPAPAGNKKVIRLDLQGNVIH